MTIEEIWAKHSVYRGLQPTKLSKPEFKRRYREIRERLIKSGEYTSQSRKLNRRILEIMGEFPYWKYRDNSPVSFGEGMVHKMSKG